LRVRTLDVDGEGSFQIEARGDRVWTGKVATRSTWSDLPVDATAQFHWERDQLLLDPLVGHSPGGDLDGRMVWSKQAWEIGGDADHADPAHWDVIGLHGWPAGNLNGRFRYT